MSASRDLKSPEDFSGMGGGKSNSKDIMQSCCNIHNATTQATVEPTTAETLPNAWVPARA
jgi:hypothetical protein